MEIHFKNVRGKDGQEEITPELTAVAQRKLFALKKLLNKGNHVAQVYVEFGKVSEAHENGNVWHTQINMECKGKRYHSAATAEKIEAATDKAIKELEMTLRKSKERRLHLIRKGGSAIKSAVRGFGGGGGSTGSSFA